MGVPLSSSPQQNNNPKIRGELAIRREASRRNLVFGWILSGSRPWSSRCASAAKLRDDGPILGTACNHALTRAPPPRTGVGSLLRRARV